MSKGGGAHGVQHQGPPEHHRSRSSPRTTTATAPAAATPPRRRASSTRSRSCARRRRGCSTRSPVPSRSGARKMPRREAKSQVADKGAHLLRCSLAQLVRRSFRYASALAPSRLAAAPGSTRSPCCLGSTPGRSRPPIPPFAAQSARDVFESGCYPRRATHFAQPALEEAALAVVGGERDARAR